MGHCFCICVRSLLAKERHNDTWLSTSHTIAHCTCHTVRHSCIIRKKTARGPGLPFTFPYVHVWIWYYTVCVARCLDVTVLPSRCPSAPEVNRIVMANDRQHRKTADRCRKLCDVIVWALTACWLAVVGAIRHSHPFSAVTCSYRSPVLDKQRCTVRWQIDVAIQHQRLLMPCSSFNCI